MTGRRGATGLAGVLPVDKPAGMTSHDVVAAIRRATGEGRVGHAGTLDPLATGLLVVLVGPYTRLEPYLSGATKTYEARIAFGSETDTDDAEGATVSIEPVPDELFDAHRAQSALDAFLGEGMQTPPTYSAIKVDGRVAHRAARSGEALALQPRAVSVEVAELWAMDARARTWDVLFSVSKGTYVRALARDIGRACGTAAHLTALRRTESGFLHIDQAHALERVLDASVSGTLPELFADPAASLGLPVVEGDPVALAAGSPMPGGLAPWA
ncbi:MAG TPA: tRNA pseudouridine(55) synthase TruB, partial [Coriobacteriia bacterium]